MRQRERGVEGQRAEGQWEDGGHPDTGAVLNPHPGAVLKSHFEPCTRAPT